MNKAITDGLVLMPPAFESGLDLWSREDGTPGSASYQGAGNASFVPADQDFGGCLEVQKTQATQKIRSMGETPLLPGCYLRVTARVKAVSGNLPTVRIAAWAGGAGGAHVSGVTEIGPEVALTSYGTVTEVSAIIGTGARTGVDMVWGSAALYGHFGLDLTGATNGVIRIDDIEIEDVTSAFLRSMMDWVDVRDYGAVGNGSTDDRAAFFAADQAADGRDVYVPAGVYKINSHLTLNSKVRFEGRVSMPDKQRLILRGSFDLQSYVDAFGNEVLGFKKAFQALLNYSDHESLDMCGLRVDLDAPIDLQAAEGTQTTFEVRRVIRNGQFNLVPSSNWDDEVYTSQASYSTNNPFKLTNVANIANIPVGALVTGYGVGREIYVQDVNVGAGSLTLSQPLYDANASQSYTFRRFKYLLDFSGFSKLSKFTMTDVEFQCNGDASAVMLAPAGETFHLRDCFVTRFKDRGVTSIGRGCQDLQLDRCHFVSDEQSTPATARKSLGFNVQANDAKIRDNRFQRLGITALFHGTGNIIMGNHLFQGDNETGGARMPGLIFAQPNLATIINGNYIDNCFIEWTNEHDTDPRFGTEYSFGGLTVTGNIFIASNMASWFNWIVIKPYGTGHFIQGLNVQGNSFRTFNGAVDRIEKVDTSFADLDFGRSRNVTFEGNTFNGINQPAMNPVTLEFAQNSAGSNWTLDVSSYLPFGGWARTVESVIAEGYLRNGSNSIVGHMPAVTLNYGSGKNTVQLNWVEAVKGKVHVVARMDRPV